MYNFRAHFAWRACVLAVFVFVVVVVVVAHQGALDCGLNVIACIGESLEVREANKTLEVSWEGGRECHHVHARCPACPAGRRHVVWYI